jgi:hypothetical protein
VYRVGACAARRRQQRRNVEVALAYRRRADAHGLVGQGDMQRPRIGFAVNGHRAVAQGLGCADDPAGDFSAVGDQDFFKHAQLPRKNPLRTLCVPCDVALPLRRLASAGRRGWQSGFW